MKQKNFLSNLILLLERKNTTRFIVFCYILLIRMCTTNIKHTCMQNIISGLGQVDISPPPVHCSDVHSEQTIQLKYLKCQEIFLYQCKQLIHWFQRWFKSLNLPYFRDITEQIKMITHKNREMASQKYTGKSKYIYIRMIHSMMF